MTKMATKTESYGFADGYGNPIARGYQCWPHEAHAKAQREADARAVSVDYWIEGDVSEACAAGRTELRGESVPSLVTVEPQG